MTDEPVVPQQPKPLVELGPEDHYRLPETMQIQGAAFVPSEGRVRIHLILETGHVLDIPMTLDTATSLRNWLDSALRKE